ncbi:MAG: DUF1232 domain-containing protein [Burkholderiaceae bacterium]
MWLRVRRLVRMLGRDALVLWFSWRDPATPLAAKLACLLLALYVLSPVDLVPDWLPLLGWIDDATLLAFGLPLLLRLLPPAVRAAAQDAAADWRGRWRLHRQAGMPK